MDLADQLELTINLIQEALQHLRGRFTHCCLFERIEDPQIVHRVMHSEQGIADYEFSVRGSAIKFQPPDTLRPRSCELELQRASDLLQEVKEGQLLLALVLRELPGPAQ